MVDRVTWKLMHPGTGMNVAYKGSEGAIGLYHPDHKEPTEFIIEHFARNIVHIGVMVNDQIQYWNGFNWEAMMLISTYDPRFRSDPEHFQYFLTPEGNGGIRFECVHARRYIEGMVGGLSEMKFGADGTLRQRDTSDHQYQPEMAYFHVVEGALAPVFLWGGDGTGLDLSGETLSTPDQKSPNGQYALINANLTGADLTACGQLDDAWDLTNATIASIKSDPDIFSAGANLTKAHITDCQFNNFETPCDLASFENVKAAQFYPRETPNGVTCKTCNFNQAQVQYNSTNGGIFINCDFSQSIWNSGNYRLCEFTTCDFTSAEMDAARNFMSTSFTGCDLTLVIAVDGLNWYNEADAKDDLVGPQFVNCRVPYRLFNGNISTCTFIASESQAVQSVFDAWGYEAPLGFVDIPDTIDTFDASWAVFGNLTQLRARL